MINFVLYIISDKFIFLGNDKKVWFTVIVGCLVFSLGKKSNHWLGINARSLDVGK